MKIFKSQQGAIAIIAAIVVAGGILSIALSSILIALNNRHTVISFSESLQSFYAAESGVGEALLQLRREPSNFVFREMTVGGVIVTSEFIEEEGGACNSPSECQYVPDSGWWAEYFNYSVNHPDMEVFPIPGPTPDPTEHDWYDDTYKTNEQVDANLEFLTSQWFPYDGSIWENKEGYAHDYHFGVHWRAKVTVATAGDYSYSLTSNDDAWVLLNGLVVVNNSGVHTASTQTGNISLLSGDNSIDAYFAERHTPDSGFFFNFDDPNLVITPWPEGCGEDLECSSNILATASTTKAARKVRYTCNNDIANCYWRELVP